MGFSRCQSAVAYTLLLALATTLFAGTLQGVYKYTYEYNTPDLKEDHYMEFKDGTLTYYGTSDLMDEAREGYLPGFFKIVAKDLVISASTITFSLQLPRNVYMQKAMTPFSSPKNNKPWEIGIEGGVKEMKGQILDGGKTIELEGEFGKMKFVQVQK